MNCIMTHLWIFLYNYKMGVFSAMLGYWPNFQTDCVVMCASLALSQSKRSNFPTARRHSRFYRAFCKCRLICLLDNGSEPAKWRWGSPCAPSFYAGMPALEA